MILKQPERGRLWHLSDRPVRLALPVAAAGLALLLMAVGHAPDASAKKASKGSSVTPASKILRNGYVYTVDRKDSVKRAIAIRGGKIAYVGSNRQAMRFRGPRTKVINLKGQMVMPGLQDGHIHQVTKGAPECSLNWEPLTVAEFKTKISACLDNPAFSRGEDEWLGVSNWYLQFTQPAGTTITKADLDSVSGDRPVVIGNWDFHTALANTKALDLAGITAATPDPPGGSIERDSEGNPTGYLQDAAQWAVRAMVPPGPAVDPMKAARGGMAILNKQGITSFLQPIATTQTMAPFSKLAKQGKLNARGHFMVSVEATEAAEKMGKIITKLKKTRAKIEQPRRVSRQIYGWRPGNKVRGHRVVSRPGVSVDGVKLFLDGVIQYPAQTAAVLEPYLENVGTESSPIWQPRTGPGARGELYFPNPLLKNTIARLEKAGFQTHMHSDGDRAVRTALNAVAAVRKKQRFDSRPALAHNEIINPNDLPRFRKLNAIPVMSFQWGKPGPDQNDSVKDYFGPTRWNQVEAFGALAANKAPIAYGSDHPVDPLDLWFAMEVAVLHEADWPTGFPQYDGKLNSDPGLTLKQSIRAFTMGSAYELHQDRSTGSLEKGKAADLLILNQNLFKIDPDLISETKVKLTMVGGKVVYRAKG